MANVGHKAVYEQTAKVIREKVEECREYEVQASDVQERAFAIVRGAALRELADLFAGNYQADNPRFDHDRFMTACGFEVKR